MGIVGGVSIEPIKVVLKLTCHTTTSMTPRFFLVISIDGQDANGLNENLLYGDGLESLVPASYKILQLLILQFDYVPADFCSHEP